MQKQLTALWRDWVSRELHDETDADEGDAVSYTAAICNAGPTEVACDLGNLQASASVSVTVNATAATAGTQTMTAAVTSSTTDPSTANNAATASTTANAAAAPTAPAAPDAGGHGGGGQLSLLELVAALLLVALRGRAATCRRRPRPARMG